MTIDQLIDAAFGARKSPKHLIAAIPEASRIVRFGGHDWAVFPVAGTDLSVTDRRGVENAPKQGARPVLVASSYDGIKIIQQDFVKLRAYVLYEIAGQPRLISPVPSKRAKAHKINQPIVRVNDAQLQAICSNARIPRPIKSLVKQLRRTYHPLHHGGQQNDAREQDILMAYAKEFLAHVGLEPQAIASAAMIRTLEGGDLGSGRDHFFHSFQNYFLGVPVIAEMEQCFVPLSPRVRLDWACDPQAVWFLTSMWHDVGYAIQKFDNLYGAAYGLDSDDDSAETAHSKFMERPRTIEAIRVISSLILRFLKPEGVTTAWLPPASNASMRGDEVKIQDAIHANCERSHGALGAIRLYCDYFESFKLKDAGADALRQTVLLACCSMPFHDWFFREDMRKHFGDCVVSSEFLPFATLLAFIDSIQDDRRELSGPLPARIILDSLTTNPDGRVSAAINREQFAENEILGKILEAIDVRASFIQGDSDLFIEYPLWMNP